MQPFQFLTERLNNLPPTETDPFQAFAKNDPSNPIPNTVQANGNHPSPPSATESAIRGYRPGAYIIPTPDSSQASGLLSDHLPDLRIKDILIDPSELNPLELEALRKAAEPEETSHPDILPEPQTLGPSILADLPELPELIDDHTSHHTLQRPLDLPKQPEKTSSQNLRISQPVQQAITATAPANYLSALPLQTQDLWLSVLERLKAQMTKPSFETWIAPLRLGTVSQDSVALTVDSEFNRDWVLKKYRALLTEAFSSRLERMVMIQVNVDENLRHEIQAEPLPPNMTTALFNEKADPGNESTPARKSPEPKKQSVWTPRTAQSNLNPKYTFDHFIVGQGNRFCHAAALAVAETPAQSYNPFFIYGGAGLGKTHLMQAIAHFAHQHHSQLQVRYVTAEQFTNDLIQAITTKTTKTFRDRYRKNDILMIDDIQFLEGKERTQEEVFHTFNALHQSGKQVILSSDRSPRYLSRLEERLKSRFEWGLIADIQPADFETRLAILQSKVKRDHFHVPDDVLVFIAESYPNNIRELEGALNKVTAFGMLTKTILDLPTAKQVLGTMQESTQISKEKILEVVAKYYHLSAAELKSPSRAKDISHARQVSIYVLRHLTEASFPKIGDLLGGRKHTTILYAYEKIKEELERHSSLAQQVQEITGRVKAP